MNSTSAERAKSYRERLKTEDPEHFETIKRRNNERTKAKYKRVSELSKEELLEQRAKWREIKWRKLKKLQET